MAVRLDDSYTVLGPSPPEGRASGAAADWRGECGDRQDGPSSGELGLLQVDKERYVVAS